MAETKIESPFAKFKAEMLGESPIEVKEVKNGIEEGDGKGKTEITTTSEGKTNINTDEVLSPEEIAANAKIADEAEKVLAAQKAKEEGKVIPQEEEVEGTYQIFAKQLAEKGIIGVDIPEDMEDSDEALENLIVASNLKFIEERDKALPEDLQKLLGFVKDGGDPKQFMDIYYGNISVDELDMTLEDNQKYVIEQALIVAGQSPEDITAAMTEYEDGGLLEKEAKRGLKVLQKLEKQNKDLILETQKNLNAKRIDDYNKEIAALKEDITKAEDIKGFKLTTSEKTKLYDYITKPVDKKTGKTQMTIDYEADKASQIAFSYMMMKKWDVSNLKKEIKTEVTSALKKSLTNAQPTGRQKIIKGSSDVTNENVNPFAAFLELT